jgi:hypothetical protein
MSGDGYTLDPEQLVSAGKGIDAVIGELNGMGIASSGEAGRGFSSLSMSKMTVGHAGLQEALDTFAGRWEWGVRTLVEDGQQYAIRLGLSAGAYTHLEEYVSDTFKQLGATAFADPHLTGNQIDQLSWDQLNADASTPDYSPESFSDAGDQAASTWKGIGRDLAEGDQTTKFVEEQLGVRDRLERQRDEMFGPLPGGGD